MQQKTGLKNRKTTLRSASKTVRHPADTFYGYDFALLVDAKTGKATPLGGKEVPSDLYQKNTLHIAALEKALKQGVYHYEWSDAKDKLYQTTCLAVPSSQERSSVVLAFSRDITQDAAAFVSVANTLHDFSTPRTFAQILLAAREAEKKEISKALHDEIGSSAVMLTALLSIVRAGVQAGQTKQALRDLTQLDTQLKQSVDRIKNVIVSLRPPSLENKGGLGGAIRDLLDNISSLSHISYTFDYDDVEDRVGLSDNVKIVLYRIVQEALTNTVKHARAKKVRVSLREVGSQIHLVVKDDGIGFKPAKQFSLEHIGLLAMKDSVKLLDGTITVKSAPGKGTRIEVYCPCIVYGGNSK